MPQDNLVIRPTLTLRRVNWSIAHFPQTISHLKEDFPELHPWLIKNVQKWKIGSLRKLQRAIRDSGNFNHQVHIIPNNYVDVDTPHACHDFNDVIRQCDTEKELLNTLVTYYTDRVHLEKPWTEAYQEYNVKRRKDPNRGHDWTYYGDEEPHFDEESVSESA